MRPTAEERTNAIERAFWTEGVHSIITGGPDPMIRRGAVARAIAQAYADGRREEQEIWATALVDSDLPIDQLNAIKRLVTAIRARMEEEK